MPTFSPELLRDLSRDLFVTAGVPEPDAVLVADSLVEANLRGHDSHGVMRVPQYVQNLREGRLVAGIELEVLNETPALFAADAGWGLGQVQAHRMLDRLLEKARTLGIAAGTLRRCGHTGRLGEYAEKVASLGLAFFGAVNSHGSGRRVSPPGGTQGRISTNPLCIGAPTAADPLVLDIGTSAAAEGKVRVAFQKGEPVPLGWLLDAQGQPTTDPSVLYNEPRGSILPIGGPQAYKGFGLGMMLDVLVGGLSGGDCSREDRPLPGLGNTVLFVVFDPSHFGGRDHFVAEVSQLAGFVRSCPTAEGVSEIVLPGDPERKIREARLRDGITIAEWTWALLTQCAVELGVAVPQE